MIHLLGTELSGQAPRQTTEGHCFERDEDGLRGLAPDSDLQHRTQRPPGDACCRPAGVEKQEHFLIPRRSQRGEHVSSSTQLSVGAASGVLSVFLVDAPQLS